MTTADYGQQDISRLAPAIVTRLIEAVEPPGLLFCPFWRTLPAMIVVAHRGCFGPACTENTLEAFSAALAIGADGIELDLRLSKDGEIVIVHDANLHRVAGDAHKVIELTAEELADISLRHGGSIPTLADVTSHVHAPAILDLEIKHHDAVGPLIRKLHTSSSLRDRSIVSSFHAKSLLEIQTQVPGVRTLFLVPRWPLPLRDLGFWKKLSALHPWGVAFPISRLNARRVSKLKRLGFAVGAWDVRGRKAEALKAQKLNLDLAIIRDISAVRSVS